MDEAPGVDLQLLIPSTKILQWQLGKILLDLSAITTEIEGSKVFWSITSFTSLVQPSP
jgi:hypothetical protein